MVDFILTEQQLSMQKMARDFAEKEIKPVAMEMEKISDPKEAFPVDLVKKGFELGFHKMTIPKEYGGLGLDCLTHLVIAEELAAADAGFCLTFVANAIELAYAMNQSTNAQRETFLRAIGEGEGGLVAMAWTEPNVGPGSMITDPTLFAHETTARLEGNEYVLNGEKIFCTNGDTPFTKWYVIFARTDMTKRGSEAHSGFYVWAGTPGLNAGKPEDKMGHRLSYNTTIHLDELRVPKDRLVGGVSGIHREEVRSSTVQSWIIMGGVMLGLARSAYEEAFNYAKQRMILGKPSIQKPLVAAKLADMYIGIEAARALAWKAAWYSDTHPQPDYKLAYATKVMCSDVAVKVASEAVQIFGGIGYTKATLVEKLYRDAKITQIYEMPNEALRLGIAQLLQLGL